MTQLMWWSKTSWDSKQESITQFTHSIAKYDKAMSLTTQSIVVSVTAESLTSTIIASGSTIELVRQTIDYSYAYD